MSEYGQELILAYQKTHNIETRNELIDEYTKIVKICAKQTYPLYCQIAEMDDIVSEGIITLIQCFDTYDHTKNTKFETYAFLRIKGSIIDFIRKRDFLPRRLRQISKQMLQAKEDLQNELCRDVSEEEVADYLHMDIQEFNKYQKDIYNANLLSFEETFQKASGKSELEATYIDDPKALFQNKELKKALVRAMKTLSEREQQIISLYYVDQLKLNQIAIVLEISESRVCQIHSSVIQKLRNEMLEYVEGSKC